VFTGIIEEVGKVISSQADKLVIAASEVLKETRLGDSIAVNGICLTVSDLAGDSFSVDIMPETQRRTNLGKVLPGDKVNLERAMALGGRMGGHLVEGHVDATGKVAAVAREADAILVKFEAPPEIMRYIVEKGFIAVDGASLTIARIDTGSFWISMVEFTQKNTTLGNKQSGDTVNLEVDIIAKYVERFVENRKTGITQDLLKEHGF